MPTGLRGTQLPHHILYEIARHGCDIHPHGRYGDSLKTALARAGKKASISTTQSQQVKGMSMADGSEGCAAVHQGGSRLLLLGPYTQTGT